MKQMNELDEDDVDDDGIEGGGRGRGSGQRRKCSGYYVLSTFLSTLHVSIHLLLIQSYLHFMDKKWDSTKSQFTQVTSSGAQIGPVVRVSLKPGMGTTVLLHCHIKKEKVFEVVHLHVGVLPLSLSLPGRVSTNILQSTGRLAPCTSCLENSCPIQPTSLNQSHDSVHLPGILL